MDSIPVINIGDLLANNEGKSKVSSQIRDACIHHGFFYISGHGIDINLQDKLESLSRQFFAMPVQKKNEIKMSLGGKAWRGFFPVGGELTSGHPDKKEGIYFGTELPQNHPEVEKETPLHGQNLFLAENDIPQFKDTVLAYIEAVKILGQKLMEGIALSLDLNQVFFYNHLKLEDPLVLFRIFNYPASVQEDEGIKESEFLWGVGEHTDYGLLTILKQDHLGGLEIKCNSKWIPAPPIKNTFICNIGDMLERISKGLYKSTPHRVKVTKSDMDRLSFPLFLDPNWNSEIKAIPNIEKQLDLSTTIENDKKERWDKASVHEFQGIYGDYLLGKVSKVFPDLGGKVL